MLLKVQQSAAHGRGHLDFLCCLCPEASPCPDVCVLALSGIVADVLLQEAGGAVLVVVAPVADVGCAGVAVGFSLHCCNIMVGCLVLRCLLIFDVLPPRKDNCQGLTRSPFFSSCVCAD